MELGHQQLNLNLEYEQDLYRPIEGVDGVEDMEYCTCQLVILLFQVNDSLYKNISSCFELFQRISFSFNRFYFFSKKSRERVES